MLFLGTGAAEMYPNPFCNCETCERARKQGETPRKRSALLIDEETLMDFGPDVPAASQMYGAPLDKLKRVFITHTHEDHLSASTLNILTMTPCRQQHPIEIYLSQEALRWVMQAAATNAGGMHCVNELLDRQIIDLIPIEPYSHFTVDNIWGYAVLSNHHGNGENERAMNYRLDMPNGCRILYVVDSGLYSWENMSALRGSYCDILVMEGTDGSQTVSRDSEHLNAELYCENVGNMLDSGIIRKDSLVYVTHINQVNRYSHAEYQRYLDENCPVHAVVAQDGLEVSMESCSHKGKSAQTSPLSSVHVEKVPGLY